MKRLLRGSVALSLSLVVAGSIDGCGSSSRDFGKGGTAGTAGSAGASGGQSADGGSSAGGSAPSAGRGGTSEGGAAGAEAIAGATSESGAGGESGAGAAGECSVGDHRLCSLGGALGSCAAGTQTCTADLHWGDCSVQPKTKDTCVAGNDDTCNGVVNEGCPCVQGQTRPCSDGGYVGKCATGKQTCGASATWGACSIAPAAADTCVLGNNDNCSGAPNEGCLCIEGVTTRDCGVCQDGKQTCTNGKTAQYGTCTGGSTTKTYYLDADGDGHAVNVSTTVCGPAPAKYITGPVDDCYDSNKDAFPGQTNYFSADRGDGSFDYNCINGEEPALKQGDEAGCSACDPTDCSCATPAHYTGATPACGAHFGVGVCCANPSCGVNCGGNGIQGCH